MIARRTWLKATDEFRSRMGLQSGEQSKVSIADTIRPWVMKRYSQSVPSHLHAFPHAVDVDKADVIAASYNVHKCVGMDGRFDPARVQKVIAELDADVVALQEVDQRFGDRAGLLDLPRLRKEAGLVPVSLVPTRNSHGWHGNLVLCREGLAHSARQIALPGVEPRGALIVDLEMPFGPLRIVAAHLGLLRRSRALQVQAILSAIRADHEIPTLLMGDLNEWRLGPRSSLLGLEGAFAKPLGLVPSFPANFPVLALDRILGNHAGMIARTQAHESPLARTASDHLPLKAWVTLPEHLRHGKDVKSAAA